MISSVNDDQKYELKISHDSTPEDIIAETIREKAQQMPKLNKQAQQKCVEEYKRTYVLKVCGCDEYILQDFPISQYKV